MGLTLTDQLRAFVDKNSGDGTPYATPGEFICDLLRREMLRQETASVRDAISEGYQDAIASCTVAFRWPLGVETGKLGAGLIAPDRNPESCLIPRRA